MSGVGSSTLKKQHLPLQSPQILPHPPNRQLSLASEDFPGFRCIVPGVTEKGKALVQPVNPFTSPLSMNIDSISKNDRAVSLEAKLCERTIKEELMEAIDDNVILPGSGNFHRKRRKPIALMRKACETQGSESTDDFTGTTPVGLAASSSCRYDSSLSLLTKKFLSLLLEANDGTLDLNKAAKQLDVQKRRMYDITNVLEGIGLIEKSLKNMIRLKATHMSRPKEVEEYKVRLRAEVEILQKEERKVDRLIREKKERLAALMEDQHNKKWLQVSREDINALPCFEDSTLIAIEAPHGTIVEVPDPSESSEFPQRISMVLRSAMGPIHCYLLSRGERFGSSNCSHHHSMGMDLCSPTDKMMGSFRSEPSSRLQQESSSCGMLKIEPSDLDIDSDYWFLSELGISLAEMWTG